MLRKVPPACRPDAARRRCSPRSHRRAGRRRRGERAHQGPTGVQAGCGAEQAIFKVPPACRPEAGGVGGAPWRVWCWFEWWPRERENEKKRKKQIEGGIRRSTLTRAQPRRSRCVQKKILTFPPAGRPAAARRGRRRRHEETPNGTSSRRRSPALPSPRERRSVPDRRIVGGEEAQYDLPTRTPRASDGPRPAYRGGTARMVELTVTYQFQGVGWSRRSPTKAERQSQTPRPSSQQPSRVGWSAEGKPH